MELTGLVRVIAVAADRNGPFAAVRIELDGRALPHDAWGSYFLSAEFDAGALRGAQGTLTLIGTLDSGETMRADLRVQQGRSR